MLTLDFVLDISAVDPGFGNGSATPFEVGIGVVWTCLRADQQKAEHNEGNFFLYNFLFGWSKALLKSTSDAGGVKRACSPLFL